MIGLKKNFFAIGQLYELGYKIQIDKGIKVVRGALVVMRAKNIAAILYKLTRETLLDQDASTSSTNGKEESTMMWLCNLDHLSE